MKTFALILGVGLFLVSCKEEKNTSIHEDMDNEVILDTVSPAPMDTDTINLYEPTETDTIL